MATTASLRLVRVHLKEQLQIQYIHERYSTSAVAYSGKHKNAKVGASVKEETTTKARPKLLHPPSKISKEYALKMVLYKDDRLIAINKPHSYAVHAGPKVKYNLEDYLNLWKFGQPDPPHLAHRLDKETTGVLLLTRNPAAAQDVAQMFERHLVQKTYLCLTVGVPEQKSGSIIIPITESNVSSRHTSKGTYKKTLRFDLAANITDEMIGSSHPAVPKAKIAKTDYSLISTYHSNVSLLAITPHTGFKHQLRVHLASGLHTPVLGDYKYGGEHFRRDPKLASHLKAVSKFTLQGALYLHAYQLIIPSYFENGKALKIRAPLPSHFAGVVANLGLTLPTEYYRMKKSNSIL